MHPDKAGFPTPAFGPLTLWVPVGGEMDINDFAEKDPELFEALRAYWKPGMLSSQLFDFIRKWKLERIRNITIKLEEQKFSLSSIYEHSQNRRNENAVLLWFKRLKNGGIPRDKYQEAVQTYKKESEKNLKSDFEMRDTVPYPIEVISPLKNLLPPKIKLGRKPSDRILRRDHKIYELLRQEKFTTLLICRELDRLKFRSPWKLKWVDAYVDKKLREKIQKLFYKVKIRWNPLS